MTLLAFRPTDDATLARRARHGDRRARRVLVRRHAARAVELVTVLVGERSDAADLASLTLSAALADAGPIDGALVRAAVEVCGRWDCDDAGLTRLVAVLTEVEGRSEADVADLLGRPVHEVADLRAAGRRSAGLAVVRRRHCRGWPLAVARERVTKPERDAADGHLELCRACRDGLRDRDEARQRLLVRGTALTGAVVGDVVAMTLPVGGGALGGIGAALGGAVAGKAGAALLGAAGLAIAAATGAVAASRGPAHHPAPPPGSVRPTGKLVGTTAPTSGGSGWPASSTGTPAPGAPRSAVTTPPVDTNLVTPPDEVNTTDPTGSLLPSPGSTLLPGVPLTIPTSSPVPSLDVTGSVTGSVTSVLPSTGPLPVASSLPLVSSTPTLPSLTSSPLPLPSPLTSLLP